MYKIILRLKYARKTLEFTVPGKTVQYKHGSGSLTTPDYYHDQDKVILEGTTYYRKNIMVFTSYLQP